ncbi:MAG: hypothetical protein AAGH15_15850 [Myxococcota bacterium]
MARFATLVRDARAAEAELLATLREVDEAKLYAVAGYGSLFAFCVEAHGMSEARAVKRIRAARLAGRHPRLLGMLRRGELRLGGIHVLGRLLDASRDPDRVLDRSRGKTVRQLEALAAELRPQPDVPSSVRRLPTPRASSTAASTRDGFVAGHTGTCREESAPDQGTESRVTSRSGSSSDEGKTRSLPDAALERRAPDPHPLRPGRFRVTVTLDEETVAALRELQDLSAHEQPNRDPAPLIAKAIRLALAEKRRAVRKERKTKRRKAPTRRTRASERAVSERAVSNPAALEPSVSDRTAAIGATASERTTEAAKAGTRVPEAAPSLAQGTEQPARSVAPTPRASPSRRAPAAVVREVWERDGARCTYVAPGGRRCAETACLELDHAMPWAKGGPSTTANLRLRCRTHNQLAADRSFGSGFMDRKRKPTWREAMVTYVARRCRTARPTTSEGHGEHGCAAPEIAGPRRCRMAEATPPSKRSGGSGPKGLVMPFETSWVPHARAKRRSSARRAHRAHGNAVRALVARPRSIETPFERSWRT